MHRVISRSLKLKVLIIFVAISVICNLCFYALYLWPSHKVKENVYTHKVWDGIMKDPVKLQYVVVHIDLKGAPPKLDYLCSLLPMLKDYGVNGLLMEYEDMFPYEGKLVKLRAKNCYERSKLKDFIEIAIDLGFEVIPLIQTFGHLEYALKLEEFRQLREIPAHPDSICPSNLESRAMVKEMLEQVIQFHKSVSPLKHIHVGCDEVYHLNECEQCKKKLFSDMGLFIDYVKHTSDLIANLSKETTVLIWDDMFRKISPLAWEKVDYFYNVEPVYWHYAELNKFPYVNIMNYHKKFKNKWIASAFKGADGRTATIPNLHKRVMNHFSWMTHLQTSKIPGEKNVYTFTGIILTGWSRYSHMDPLCELLPASIPSLVINLRMIKRFKTGGIRTSNGNIDEFYSNYLSDNDNHFLCDESPKQIPSVQYINDCCYFNGQKLYNLLNGHNFVTNEANSFLQHDEILAYEYYFKSNYVNKNADLTRHINMCHDSLTTIQGIEEEIARNMKKHFEDDVVIEYLASKSYNLKKKLTHLIQSLETSLAFNGAWEKRPTLEAVNESIY